MLESTGFRSVGIVPFFGFKRVVHAILFFKERKVGSICSLGHFSSVLFSAVACNSRFWTGLAFHFQFVIIFCLESDKQITQGY